LSDRRRTGAECQTEPEAIDAAVRRSRRNYLVALFLHYAVATTLMKFARSL
jgi:hypothetical protein